MNFQFRMRRKKARETDKLPIRIEPGLCLPICEMTVMSIGDDTGPREVRLDVLVVGSSIPAVLVLGERSEVQQLIDSLVEVRDVTWPGGASNQDVAAEWKRYKDGK